MSNAPKKVSIKDVARAAGVSIASVSRVINATPGRVSAETRERIEKAITELDYRPNRIGQALRGQMNDTFALVISSIQNNFYSAVAWEIERRLNDAGSAMLIYNSNEDPALQDRCLGDLASRQVSGVFLLCAVDTPGLQAAAGQTPLLFINRRVPSLPGVPFVGIDDKSAAAELAGAVLRETGGRIGLIHGPSRSHTSRVRRDGFLETFDAAGRRLEGDSVVEAELSMESGYACAGQLLESGRYAALICGNDQIAYGAFRRCRELGLTVPSDLAIYGFDDNPLNQWLAPWLNTVSVPHLRFAEAAVAGMMKLVEGQRPGDTILPYDLVLRR
ncbi:transcriptional regulator (LacI family protein) [Oceanicola granulosus HTCC2516]|uniref:Transcriptional regulator (LacI family protein) n=1 Tax=Oceanicola granulosus (strain ATCC BAA-861 / DSM 15982 / KCTC 12143 / HTCC2516) TaxID=314256 RepID=Q2CEL5_OCEGH|nr:LacI family DNA-binding transcriptional regulator [Oceanicola granulosus]EAR51117.1 transcriptional regulator (LacI family protein) [Oceanicola granulosus HTCC2516]